MPLEGMVRMAEGLRCPVCLDLLMNPHSLPCNHTFCLHCLLNCFGTGVMACPLCRAPAWKRQANQNHTIAQLCSAFKFLEQELSVPAALQETLRTLMAAKAATNDLPLLDGPPYSVDSSKHSMGDPAPLRPRGGGVPPQGSATQAVPDASALSGKRHPPAQFSPSIDSAGSTTVLVRESKRPRSVGGDLPGVKIEEHPHAGVTRFEEPVSRRPRAPKEANVADLNKLQLKTVRREDNGKQLSLQLPAGEVSDILDMCRAGGGRCFRVRYKNQTQRQVARLTCSGLCPY